MEKVNEILKLDEKEKVEAIFREVGTCDEIFIQFLIEKSVSLQILDENGNSLLHRIAETGNEKVFVQIANEISLDLQNKSGETPLHFSVKNNHVSFVKLLLSNGANIISDYSGIDPQQIAEEKGFADIAKLLKKRMKSIESTFLKISNMIVSQNYKEIESIVASGEYLNIRQKDGSTLLHFAASQGDAKSTQLLINSVEINTRDNNGRTATQIALDCKHLPIAKILAMNGGISYAQNEQSETSDTTDSKESSGERRRKRTTKQRQCGDIFKAIDEGKTKEIHAFVKENKNINVLNANGQTPLLYAISTGKVKESSILACKPSVNYINSIGVTPIFYAVKDKNAAIVRILVEKGADVTFKNMQGKDVIQIVDSWADSDQKSVILLEISLGLFRQSWAFINFVKTHQDFFTERQADYLMEAIRQNNEEILLLLLDQKINLDQNLNGLSPLHYAIEHGSDKCVSVLIKAGAKLITIDGVNELDRALAVKNPNKLIISKIVSAIVGRSIKYIEDPKKFIKHLPKKVLSFPAAYFLLEAALNKLQKPIVEYLIENGLSAKCEGENGKTLLHFAAQMKDLSVESRGKLLEIIMYLNEKGSDKSAVDSNGRLALHYASEIGYPEITAELAQKSLCTFKDLEGKTPIDLAANKETKEVLLLISSRIAEDLTLPEDDDDEMEKIIKTAKDISTDMINICISKDNSKLLQIIINKGIDPNTCDTEGTYLIHYGVSNGSLNCCKLLLLYGADVNSADKEGKTPLHLAVEKENAQIAKVLIDCGAKNKRDSYDKFPIEYAKEGTPIFSLMEKYERLCRVLKHLFEKKYEEEQFKAAQTFGFIVFERTIKSGNVKFIRSIIQDFHVSPFITNPFGVTALHIACACNSPKEVIETLISLGCNKDAKTILGFTPLHFAAMSNNKEAIKILVANGANVKATNKANKTASDIAKEHGNNDVLKYLKRK